MMVNFIREFHISCDLMASFARVLEDDPLLAYVVTDDDVILDEEDQFIVAELIEEAVIRAANRDTKRRRVALVSNRQGFWETEVMSGWYYVFNASRLCITGVSNLKSASMPLWS